MIVLGYNGFSHSAAFFDIYFGMRGIDKHRLAGHDASAALFKDGILVAAAEEERFSRIKKTSDFPKNAINYCLAEAGISLKEVDYIAIPWDFNEQVVSETVRDIFGADLGGLSKQFQAFEQVKNMYFNLVSNQKIMDDFNLNLATRLGAEKFVFVPHHLAHVLCGFFLSGMKKSAFLVTDGRGELYSSVMGEIDQEQCKIFQDVSLKIPDSIGVLYRKFTRYLGYVPNCDEYKVMALGAFANSPPEYDFGHFIEFLPDGQFQIKLQSDIELHYYRFLEDFFGGRTEENDKNMAYFIQKLTEKAIWHQVKYLQDKTTSDCMLLEGGVAMNCVNNSKVLAKSRFKDVHVGFAANDAGVAIGAAFYPFYQKKAFKSNTITPYLGPQFSHQEVLNALNAKSEEVTFRELEENALFEVIIEHLSAKKIIGWFQGRMEYGPRALGNRSILANPAFPDMKDIINAKVKFREGFRPFAGVILDTEADNFFEMGKKESSPFMTFVFEAKPQRRDKLSSALHIDNTSRVQTLSEQQNPKLYNLLLTFKEKTGIPCIINTSFNVMGEPIVCNPSDAVNCFLNSGIDVLVMENFLVSKKVDEK